jgi:heme-degrading monooxygenase HmoA
MTKPYYAVIFTSSLKAQEKDSQEGYGEMSEKMARMVSEQPGFLGFDSARDKEGKGVTVSYWDSVEAIRAWRAVAEHREAQAKGRSNWYASYRIRISEVLEERGFGE